MKLTEHFTLEELTYTDHRQFDNTPDETQAANLRRLARLLEEVRTLFNNQPILINSAFRSKAVNDAVGSKDTSQHRLGCAADFRIPGLSPDQIVRVITNSVVPYDQVIREFDRWTHISVPNTLATPPRRQALIIDAKGTRPFV